ncbi:MAG: nucleoside hydrolase [Spirochaetales bacterium]|nr:nucleoside hydrolase [Spirochaetales bacterium]
MSKAVILDCDPGHDDAIAIMLALASDSLDVRLITVSAGNSSIEKTTLNAMKVVSFLGKEVEVAAGAIKPLRREVQPDIETHGESGLDGPELPAPSFLLSSRTALEAQAAVLRESEEKVTIIPTGPLTNVALLLSAHPELTDKIERIVLMGGACFGGNWLPDAEFNIMIDPEAADIVFRSGVPITMCGLDVTLKAQIFPDEFEIFRKMTNKTGPLVAELLDFFHKSTTPPFMAEEGHEEGAHMHDICAVAWAIAPELFVTKNLNVQIETEGRLTLGCTVVDYNNVFGLSPNADVCFDIDRKGFLQLLIDNISTLL